MAAGNTYGTMISRIADEVLGSVQVTHIENAIQDAILLYERQRWWFNENRWDMSPVVDNNGNPVLDASGDMVLSSPLLTTAAGLEFYGPATTSLIATVAHLDKLVLVQGNSRYSLDPQTPQWMDDNAVGLTWQGIPTDWSYNAQEVRLYPIPDGAYPILAWGTRRFATLVQMTDSNPWVVQAERLIRAEAKRLLFTNITRNTGQAAAMAGEVALAERALRSETAQRGPPARIRASRF